MLLKQLNIKLVAALALLLALAACAATARILFPVHDDPLKSTPGVYTLDPTHANVIFAVNHLGFSLHHGRINQLAGSLELYTQNPKDSRVFISASTASIDTNNQELDDQLKAKSMFNVEAFPKASFESTSLQLTGERSARIEGVLTIKGIRKPLVIEALFIGTGTNPLTGLETVGFSGSASFKRSDFDLKDWLPLVGDNVTLIIEAEFNRARD